MQCPLGHLKISSSHAGIEEISFVDSSSDTNFVEGLPQCHVHCIDQLNRYFAGTLKQFDLLLNPQGTSFQQKVWNTLQLIPWGITWSYASLSKEIGDPKAVRAVGMANNKNPIAIVIPCHRVIGSDGKLVGYASGLSRKEWLLRHENALEQLSLFESTF